MLEKLGEIVQHFCLSKIISHKTQVKRHVDAFQKGEVINLNKEDHVRSLDRNVHLR